jgi:hypothetical protein
MINLLSQAMEVHPKEEQPILHKKKGRVPSHWRILAMNAAKNLQPISEKNIQGNET